MSSFSLLIVVVFLTLAFEFSNGWHDAANSIATVVSTRVLSPFRAVAWAAFWNLITLILGLPTSSSHALMGGYGGAAVAHAGYRALIVSGWVKPVLFIFLSPIVGAVTAIILTITASWIVRKQRPRRVDKIFRRL